MNNLTCFDYNQNPIRVIDRDCEPWFVLADVCRVLDITNPSKAGERLEDDEKAVTTGDSLGGGQQMLIISESGLYVLIMTSRKAEAKAFRRWVTGTVLPSIRKTGAYVAPGASAQGIAAAASSSGNLIAASALLATVNGMLPDLCPESRQALAVGVLAQIGIELPSPEIEPLWQMSEIAERFGVNASVAGKLAKRHGLQTDEYGKRLVTVTPTGKQVAQFRYNTLGRKAVERVLADMVEPVIIGEFESRY